MDRTRIVGAIIVFVLNIGVVTVADEVVDDLLHPSRYDKRIRPFGDAGKPVIVNLDIFLNSIGAIDEVKMDYTVNIFLRQRWIDDRLRFNHTNDTITLNYKHFDNLWVPDLFVKNEKKATFHEITVPNRLLMLSPDGAVYYSQRLSLTLTCTMHLKKFPMDNQTCRIDLESYGYTTKDLVFMWQPIDHPVQVTDDLSLPEFELVETSVGECTTEYVTGAFSCQFVHLFMVRQFQYYLIQTFIPTILIVSLSMVSFWIDINAVPARISLGLLTVLTMTTQASSISNRLPRVSYIKAIDIWMTVCLVFVFAALLEYSIVNVLARKNKARKSTESSQSSDDKLQTFDEIPKSSSDPGILRVDIRDVTQAGDNGELVSRQRKIPETKPERRGSLTNAKQGGVRERLRQNPAFRVEFISRFLFPGAFVLFNIVYWSYFPVPNVDKWE